MSTVNRLLGEDKLDFLLQKTVSGTVGDPTKPLKKTVSAEKTIPILGQALNINGELQVKLETHDKGAAVSVGSREYQPLPDTAFTEFTVAGGTGISGSGAVTTGTGVNLSISAEAGASLAYTHLMSAPLIQRRLEAYTLLIARDWVPQTANPKRLVAGELIAMSLTNNLSLGLDAKYGYATDIQEELFGGLKLPLTGSFKGAVEASLGLGIQGNFDYVLERITPQNKGWVRAALSKKHEQKISLGVTVALQLKYDLGTGLVSLLEQVLKTEPVVALKEILEKIDDDTYLNLVAEGNWDEIAKQLGGKATVAVQNLLSPYLDDALNFAIPDKALENAKEVLGGVRTLLAKYAKLEQDLDIRIEGFWERVLGYANLQPGSPFRKALKSIARLNDGDDVDQALSSLLSGEAAEAVDLLEKITGKSLEELILASSDSAKEALIKAGETADKILAVIKETPEDVLTILKKFVDNTGISAAVTWLNENVPSDAEVDEIKPLIKDNANAFIQENIQKLVGKALDAIDEDDLAELREFAGRVKTYIDDAEDGIERLKTALMRLKGEVGLTMALEWERVTARTSIVDIEFKPGKIDAAVDALALGHVAEFLRSLPDDDQDEPVYQLNQCLLTNTQVTIGAFSLMLSVFGNTKNTNRREVGETINISPKMVRTGTYESTYTRILNQGDNDVWQSTVNMTGKGSVKSKDLAKPYPAMDWNLQLSMMRNDNKTNEREIKSTGQLLTTLGFDDVDATIASSGIHANASTRLAVKLSLGPDALKTLLAPHDGDVWNRAYLNAGYWWFNTELYSWNANDFQGPELSQFVLNPSYVALFPQGNRNNRTFMDLQPTHNKTIATWKSMLYLAQEARTAPKNFKKPGELLQLKPKDLVSDNLLKGAKRFALAVKKSMPYGNWSSPTFPVYMVLALLYGADRDVLNQAKGVATFRWADSEGNWQTPIEFKLADGLSFPAPLR